MLGPNDSSTPSDEDIRPPGQREGIHQVWMLAISMGILQIGFGIITPIFPYYIGELGLGGTELGVLAASFALARILLSGPLGGLSDRTGRKPVLLFSLVGFAVANVVYAFATEVLVMIAARAVEGAVSAGFFPAANAFVSDVTSSENRGTAMGYLNIGNMVGFIVGPTAGGVLAQFLGVRLPFIVAAAGTMGTLLCVHVLVREPVRRSSLTDGGPGRAISKTEILRRHALAYLTLGVSMFASQFALGVLQVAFLLDVIQNPRPGWVITPLDIGLFFGMIGVVTVIGSIAFGRSSDRVGRKWFIVAGGFAGTCSMYMFLVSDSITSLYMAGLVLALSLSLSGPAVQALIGDLTDPRAIGVIMGLFGAVASSALVVSPLLSGLLYDYSHSSGYAVIIGAVVALLGAVVASFGLPGGRTSSVVKEPVQGQNIG